MMNKKPKGFSLPVRVQQARMVDALVISCDLEQGHACVRDERGLQYALGSSTSGLRLAGLRVGNQLRCDVAADGYSVVSARRVRRAYPEAQGIKRGSASTTARFAFLRPASTKPAAAPEEQNSVDPEALFSETGVPAEALRKLAGISDPLNEQVFSAEAARKVFTGGKLRSCQAS
jgi:hypothetical protein